MPNYGIIENGELKIVSQDASGAKLVIYAPLPEFDQLTQAVYEKAPIDMGHYILVDLEVIDIEAEPEEDPYI